MDSMGAAVVRARSHPKKPRKRLSFMMREGL
jgi:hypothetical protein